MPARRVEGKTKQLLRVWVVLAAVALAATLVALLPPSGADAVPTLPAGFQESVAFSGLTIPTTVQFSKDGRVFVAEKSGLIKVFDSLSDTTPTTFADLRTNVHSFWDRGMLGMVLDPNFPTNPHVYVLYTHDAPIGGTAPRWGQPGATSDGCPNPPGATADGCVVSGRLSRLQADPTTNTMTGNERVLIEDWCQQYPSHTVGSLVFGSDGALYVSGGDGASFNYTDYGQSGGGSGSPVPKNPCGDPPGGVGATLTPPTAEGGALRSQDLRTSGDPVGLDGSILRVDPATGDALPTNPLYGNSDPNARRIIAHGLRNPFRQTLVARPGTDEIWAGDVGWGTWEEINRIANPTDSAVENFGWPCYEGNARQSGYDGANLNICENLYGQANAVSAPHFAYRHGTQVTGENCATNNGSSVSGLAFYKTGPYPDEYDDALFFADHSRRCIWVMQKGTNGLPNPGLLKPFVTDAENPVDLQIGPNGDLFYVDFDRGAIRRIQYSAANQTPTAHATASPTSGQVPLAVNFAATGSGDPDGDTLTYEWDLDGDGAFDDSTAADPTYTYTTAGDYRVGLRVTDSKGASDTLDQPLTISAGNTPPSATIDSPLSTTTWKVGDNISFSGSATDQEDGTLGASKLAWSWIMHHCSTENSCHEHVVQDFAGVASGSFVAPDHEYPSYLELRLTATDSGGLTDTKSVRLDPKTVELSFRSDPAGLQLTVGETSATTPFSRTVIVGSKNSISAPSPQTLGGTTYGFASWSDSGAQSHDIEAPDTAATYTATYTPAITGTQSLTSAADAGLSELAPNTNNGTATTLKVDGDDPDPGGGDLYAALRWNLSQIPAGAAVSSATVTLNISNHSNDTGTPQTYGAYELKRAWNEGQVNWNQAATGTPWATPGAKGTTDRGAQIASVTPTSGTPTAKTPYTFTIPTSVVQGWLSTPSSNNGILLAHTTNFDGFVFDTKEGATAPKLTINYTTGGTDTTPPETTIDSGPSGTVGNTSASFTFSSNEAGSTFECSFDDGAYSSCTSPKDYTALLDGSHTFKVRATDAAGNVDATPASRTFSVDAAAPDTTIDSGPSGTITVADATFTFSSEAGATFECRLDGAAYAGCSSPKSYTNLSNGSHTFDVRAKDGAGNVDAVPASRTFTVDVPPLPQDTTPPETAIDSGPSGTVSSTSASFTFSSNEAGSTFECRLDGAAYGSCSSPKSYSGLSAGSHTFSVRATDAAGNVDATPATRTWTISSTTSLTSVADTRIVENVPTTNYGGATVLGADGDDPNNSGKDEYSLLRWDLSSIPAGSTVSSASVTLNVTDPSKDTYQIYDLKRPWVEPTATWLSYAAGQPWQTPGAKDSLDRGAQIGSVAAPRVGKRTYALSAAVVQGWVGSPSANNGILVGSPTSADGFDFSSRETSTASNRPQLSVTYTAP